MATKQAKEQTIRPMIQEAERALKAAVKHFGLTVDPATLVVTIQTAGRKPARGWFWAKRWQNGKMELNEINLCAEHLKTHDMGELVLHELVHAENYTNKVKDCNASQRHNKKFKVMAERLGLKCNDKPDKKYGFGITELDAEGKAFLKKIKFDEKIFDMARNIVAKQGKVGSRLRLYECSCEKPVKVRVASDDFDATCNICDCAFELVEK